VTSGGAWSTADLASILIALGYLLFGLWLDWGNRGADRIIEFLANGLSLGPLLMIVADPLLELSGIRLGPTELVMVQARLVLWWGAAVAAIHILKALFK
jgi:hypothetical protein